MIHFQVAAHSREKNQVREDICKAKTSLGSGILQSMLGSVAFLFLIGAFLMVLIGYRSGTDQMVEELTRIVGGIEVQPTPAGPAQSIH